MNRYCGLSTSSEMPAVRLPEHGRRFWVIRAGFAVSGICSVRGKFRKYCCPVLLMKTPALLASAVERLPDGQIASDFPKSCQARESKIFCFSCWPNQRHIWRHPVPGRGALAIVTNVGRAVMDAAASGASCNCRAGFSREQSTLRRRSTLLRTAKPCGPGTRCWCQAGGGFRAQPGFAKPLIRRRR
jgi:hypothetical protein